MRQHDEAEREKLAAMRKQMRGRTYAYDHRGQVVLVSPIDPQRLPRPMTPVVRVTASRGRRSGASCSGGGATGGGGQVDPALKGVGSFCECNAQLRSVLRRINHAVLLV